MQGFGGADADAGFVGPEARDVARGVATTAEDEEGEVEFLDSGDAGAVSTDVKVEAAEAVATEGVGAALEDDSGGVVGGDTGGDDFVEEARVGVVVNAVEEGDVEGVVGTWVGGVQGAGVVDAAGAGEEDFFFVFVEGECHYSIGGPEGLLDAVAVVDVDVDVEDAGVVEEELEDG